MANGADMKSSRGKGWCLAALSLFLLSGMISQAGDSEPISYRHKLEQLRKERQRHPNRPQATRPEVKGANRLPYIDEMVAASWKDVRLVPSAECTDGEFIRRASLDLIGRIPTYDETKSFLDDHSSDKRARLVRRLIDSESFGTHLANTWIKLLIPDELSDPRDVNRPALHVWLEKEFNRGRPWNEMVHDLIAATGRWDENPAVNFILANQDGDNAIRTTATVTKLFLGVQTQCTECHNHPWNSWKQDQFHGLRAFFLGTREKRATRAMAGQMLTDSWTLDEVPMQEVMNKGVYFERRNGLSVLVEPTYLDGEAVQKTSAKGTPDVRDLLRESDGSGRPVYLREELARRITADDNPYFARAMVNRVWYQLMGHSFTKNVDDFDNGIDDPSMPDLLDQLAEDFKANGYDVKRLVEWIANSRPYGLSSRRKGKETNEAVGFFSFQLVKPLSPEQLYDSVLTLTGIDRASKTANASTERQRFIQEFQRTFGTDEIPTAAPTYDGTITQSLMMMNSWLMSQVCSCVPGSFLHDIVTDESMNDRERVEAIFIAGLARKPTANEAREIAGMIAMAGDDRPGVFADILWATINSAEFVLNH